MVLIHQINPQLHATTLTRKWFLNTRVKYLCMCYPALCCTTVRRLSSCECERDRELECKKKQTATETAVPWSSAVRKFARPPIEAPQPDWPCVCSAVCFSSYSQERSIRLRTLHASWAMSFGLRCEALLTLFAWVVCRGRSSVRDSRKPPAKSAA